MMKLNNDENQLLPLGATATPTKASAGWNRDVNRDRCAFCYESDSFAGSFLSVERQRFLTAKRLAVLLFGVRTNLINSEMLLPCPPAG